MNNNEKVWWQKLDGRTAVLESPHQHQWEEIFFPDRVRNWATGKLNGSGEEQQGSRGSGLLSHLAREWNCLHTHRDKVIRQVLEQHWLPCILMCSLAHLDFSSIPGEVPELVKHLTWLPSLFLLFVVDPPWLFIFLSALLRYDWHNAVCKFKAWDVMYWYT